MKIINRRVKFYNRILEDIKSGAGYIYRISMKFNTKENQEKLTRLDINPDELDKKNKTYVQFLWIIDRMKKHGMDKVLLSHFLVNLYYAQGGTNVPLDIY